MSELAVIEKAPDGSELLTADEVRQRLKVSRAWVYGEIKAGRLPAIYIGRLPRVRRSDLDAFVAAAGARR